MTDTPYTVERRIRHKSGNIKLRTPYNVARKMAGDTSAFGHHDKLAEIVTNTELTFLITAMFLCENYGDDMLIRDIIRQRIQEVLNKYREEQNV